MSGWVSRSAHTRRQFFRAAAAVGAAIAAGDMGRVVAEADVFEARLDAY